MSKFLMFTTGDILYDFEVMAKDAIGNHVHAINDMLDRCEGGELAADLMYSGMAREVETLHNIIVCRNKYVGCIEEARALGFDD